MGDEKYILGTSKMDVEYRKYEDERQIEEIDKLVSMDLSEPYSIFTYRYFVSEFPDLTELAYMPERGLVGCVVCRVDEKGRGYIGMLAVDKEFRRHKIGVRLVLTVLERMRDRGIAECVLEAEVDNMAALGFYRNLGFVRTKRLSRYYLSGKDAFRLKKSLV
jgi:peptide alpha-N-acetyltransferase